MFLHGFVFQFETEILAKNRESEKGSRDLQLYAKFNEPKDRYSFMTNLEFKVNVKISLHHKTC